MWKETLLCFCCCLFETWFLSLALAVLKPKDSLPLPPKCWSAILHFYLRGYLDTKKKKQKNQGLKFLLYLSVRTQVKSNDLGHSHFCPSTSSPHWLHIDLGLFSATPRGLDDSTWSSIQFVCSPGLPLWQWSLVPLSSDLKLPSLLMF